MGVSSQTPELKSAAASVSCRSFPGSRGRKHVCLPVYLPAGRVRAPGGRVRLSSCGGEGEAVHEPGPAGRENRDRDGQQHGHREDDRHRPGQARSPRHPGLSQQRARRGRAGRCQEGERQQPGGLHAAGPGEPEVCPQLRRNLLEDGTQTGPPDQQRRGVHAGPHGGRAGDDVWRQPRGPLPADPPAAGPAEAVRPQPGRERGLAGPQLRNHRLRLPDQAQGSGAGDLLHEALQDLLRQQTVQRALHPRTRQEAGGHQGHLLLPPPGCHQVRAGQEHQLGAAAPDRAHDRLLLQEHGPGGPDHPALRPAGGHRAPDRALLLQLHREGALRQGYRRRRRQETVGAQREAVWPRLRCARRHGNRAEPSRDPRFLPTDLT